MSTLRFIFGLTDNMSGPAGRIISQLRAMTAQIERTRLAFNRLYENTKAIRAATLTMFAGVAGAGAAGLVAVGRLAIGAAAFKENAMAAFTTLVGSKKEAASIFSEALRFAAVTPFDTRQVVEGYQRLLAAGFKRNQIPVVLSAVGDLSSMKGFTQEAVDRITLAVTQIKAKGRVQGDELIQLAEAGLPLTKFYDVLAKKLNTTVNGVRKLQEAGKINSDLGIWAVLETVRTTLSGGQLGGLMAKTAQNLTGLWSTLKSRPFEIFSEMDKSGGFLKLKGLIGNLADALDTMTPRGQRFAAALRNAFDTIFSTVFGPLEEATRGGNIDVWIDRLTVGAQKFAQAWRTYFPQVIAFVRGLGQGFAAVGGPIMRFFSGIVKANGGGAEGAAKLGEMVGKLLALAAAFSFLLVPINLLFKLFGVLSNVWGLLRSIGPAVKATVGFIRSLGVIVTWVRTTLVGLQMWLTLAAAGGGALGTVAGWLGTALAALTGPVGWAIAAVVALVAAAVWAYNRFDWFRAAIDGIWQLLKDGVKGLVDFWVGTFQFFIGWLTGNKEMQAAGADLLRGLWQGMVGLAGWLKDNIVGLGQNIAEWFKGVLGIHSPSTVFAEFGVNIVQGLMNGLEQHAPWLASTIKGIGATLQGAWDKYAPMLGLGGGQAGRGGPAAGGVPSSPTGGLAGTFPAISGGNSKIAKAAIDGLTAGWAESLPGYCSRFVRQVFSRALGPATAKLFGSSAIQTEQNFRRAGLAKSLAEMGGAAALRAGDVLFQGFGSGGYGHTGIYVGNGMVAQNTTAAGGGKKLLSLASFGTITSVGRIPGADGAPVRAPSGAVAPAPISASGGGKTAVVNMTTNVPPNMKPSERDALLSDVEQRAYEGAMRGLEALAMERGHQ